MTGHARRWTAAKLRRLADRLDHRGAPKCMGWYFTFEHHRGIVFRDDARGCPLWYFGDDDYQRAHDEADTEHTQVDWATMTTRRAGGAR